MKNLKLKLNKKRKILINTGIVLFIVFISLYIYHGIVWYDKSNSDYDMDDHCKTFFPHLTKSFYDNCLYPDKLFPQVIECIYPICWYLLG